MGLCLSRWATGVSCNPITNGLLRCLIPLKFTLAFFNFLVEYYDSSKCMLPDIQSLSLCLLTFPTPFPPSKLRWRVTTGSNLNDQFSKLLSLVHIFEQAVNLGKVVQSLDSPADDGADLLLIDKSNHVPKLFA